MRYWPFSMIAESPLLPPLYAHEWRHIERIPISRAAYEAGFHAAMQMQPLEMPNLAIVMQDSAADRRIFTGYPEFDEWFRLERGGFLQAEPGGFVAAIFDASH